MQLLPASRGNWYLMALFSKTRNFEVLGIFNIVACQSA